MPRSLVLFLPIVLALSISAAVSAVTDDAIRNGEAFSADAGDLLAAARAIPASESDGVVVLLRESEYVFDDTGRVDLRYRMIYRIVSPGSLRSWSLVTRSWSPWHQERPEIRARVITADGAEHWLDPDTLGEYSDSESGPDLYDDTMNLRGPLPAIGVDSVVEEQHIVREIRPVFDRGVAKSWLFALSVPVQRTRLIFDAPAALPLRYRAYRLPDMKETVETSAGRVRTVLETGRADPWRSSEPLSPADVPVDPVVRFSTGASWNAIAARYAEIVDETIGEKELGKVVRKALGKSRDQDRGTRIAALLDYVHRQVRYTGVEFGEQAIVPTSPGDTLERRFGDCKDKSTLLVALLREAGIDADVALLATAPGPDVDPELPGLGGFDHAIVRVAGEPEVWIDPTHRFARAGELPDQDHGRLALIADPETFDLTKTPSAVSADNVLAESREVFLAREGGARIVERSSMTGSFERSYRSVYSDRGEDSVRQHLEKYVQTQYKAEKLGALEISALDDLTRPLELRVEALSAGRAWTTTTEAWVAMPMGSLFRSLPGVLRPEQSSPPSADAEGRATPEPLREHDVVLDRPYVHEWTYRIHPPPGYALATLPETREVRFGPASLSRTFAEADDGTVTARLRFDTVQSRFSPEDVRRTRQALGQLYLEKAPRVTFFQIGESHLEAGRIRDALVEFQRLVAAYPDEAVHHAQVARTYLAAGLGAKAREEARRATRLDPRSAVAWRTLGVVLAHDELGRKFVQGFDREGAEKALRKAKELDEGDFESRGELAILLDHGPDGRRYGEGARLDEAIAEYRALREELGDEGLTTNLMLDLMYTERFAELEKLADEAPRTIPRDGLRLAALAATRGVEAAVAEASRIASGADEYRQMLTSAGEWIVRGRRYPEAAGLIAAGAKGAPDAVERLAMADLFGKTRRYEEFDATPATPEGLVRRLLIAVVGQDDADQARALLAREPFDATLAAAFIEDLQDDLRALEWSLRQWGISRKSVLDMMFSLGRFAVQGADGPACHVRLRLLGVPGVSADSAGFFLVREGDGFRLAGTDDLRTPTARLILDWLDADDPEPAMRWLDVLVEGAGGGPTGDPLTEHPLRRLWAGGVERDVASARIAAASLVDHPSVARRAVTILQDALEELADDERKDAVALALVHVAAAAEQIEVQLSAARRVRQAHPRSPAAFQFLFGALVDLRRYDEAQREVDARLEQFPGDPFTATLHANVAMLRDDTVEWRKRLDAQIATGRAGAGEYNNLAWLDLCEGNVSAATLQNAQQAVLMDQYANPASLHTLATVYADLGRAAEARDVLLQLLENRTTGDLDSPDWYVLGRIAEEYGVVDAARDAYSRVEPPEDGIAEASSTWALATRRQAALEEARN